MWKTPVLLLKRFPLLPTSQKHLCNVLRPPLFVKQLLQQRLETSGLDWMHRQKDVVVYSRVHRRLLCNKPKEKKIKQNKTKQKALQEAANQEPLCCNKCDRSSAAHYLSFNNHSLGVSSNEHEQPKPSVHCAAEQETVPLNWG